MPHKRRQLGIRQQSVGAVGIPRTSNDFIRIGFFFAAPFVRLFRDGRGNSWVYGDMHHTRDLKSFLLFERQGFTD